MHILFGSNKHPTQNVYDKASNLHQQNIMVIPTNKTKNYFITVICQSACHGKVTYYASNRIHLDGSGHFEYEGGNEEYLLAFKPNAFRDKEILQISLIGPQIKLSESNMKIGYINNDGQFISDNKWKINEDLLFENSGLSAVINPEHFKQKDNHYFYVKLGNKNSENPFLRFKLK